MPLSILTLIQRWGSRLQLRWLSGEPNTNTALSQVAEYAHDAPPQGLWLLSAAQIAQLTQLSATQQTQALAQLFAAQPGALLIADGALPGEALMRYAQPQPTPLLSSPLPLAELLRILRTLFAEQNLDSTEVHGVFLEVMGMGVLLTGDSGVGKSELALELVTRGHRLIADDLVALTRLGPDTLNGTCPHLLRDFLEVRGLGILNIRAMFGDPALKRNKLLKLIIDLQTLTGLVLKADDRLRGLRNERKILGVSVPQIILPVVMGRNLAVLVEAAVRDHLLRLRGYSAVTELTQRQQLAIAAHAL